jgi:sulfotransferase
VKAPPYILTQEFNKVMVQKVFFNSSLPRAGSTLLQNVLMQNPEIYSTPTSGVIEFLLQARTIYSTGDAFKAQDPKEMEKAFQGFCKAGLYGYFNALTDRPYVMDKSRAWTGNFRFANFIEPGAKAIVMVRDLRAIFASMEKNYRKNPHKDPLIVNGAELKNMTTDTRLQHFSVAPPVGPAMEWLKDSFQQGYDQHMLFVRFEDFTTNPEIEMQRIYNYLEIPYFKHDFENVEQLTKENDVIHGIFGDHQIQSKIQPVPQDYTSILGFQNCDAIKKNYNWFFEKFNYK